MRSTYHYVVPLHFCFILSKFFAFKFQSRKREVVINLCEDTEKFMPPANQTKNCKLTSDIDFE